ncbi:MAG TPA: Crp/Fnr family transcriptional regulator [Methylovirgula sp.]|jgi:CRP-like cAMP-binding protein|nr:Crp/Fnr family transcriptional regulator [Methylovirgula sp.]
MGSEMKAGGALAAKFAAFMPDHQPLTEHELAELCKLQSRTRAVRRGDDIVVQGRAYNGIFILVDGFGLRYKVMADGKRQVLNIAVPGDLIGYPSCFFSKALFSATAITQAVVSTVTFAELTSVFHSFPRLAMAFFWSIANDTAIFGEHLANIGRRSAYERVAHFVLETSTRLKVIGMAGDTAFTMPLTQEKIADVVGLSVPHVNRMLKRLREERLIDMAGSELRILDKEALATLADFDESYLAPHPLLAAEGNFIDASGRHKGAMAKLNLLS